MKIWICSEYWFFRHLVIFAAVKSLNVLYTFSGEMGNTVTVDRHGRKCGKRKHNKEEMPKNEDRATQCSLIVPPTVCGPWANKKIQVGMKPCLTDQSTQTVSNSVIPSNEVTRNYDGKSSSLSKQSAANHRYFVDEDCQNRTHADSFKQPCKLSHFSKTTTHNTCRLWNRQPHGKLHQLYQ